MAVPFFGAPVRLPGCKLTPPLIERQTGRYGIA
jgi:hypothetical protein